MFISVITAIGTLEFYRMALPERKLESWLAALAGSAFIFIPLYGDEKTFLPALTAFFLLFSLLFLFRIKNISNAANEAALALFAFCYIPFLLMHLVLLRISTFGMEWIFLIMLIVMTNDTAAYYTGNAFGKNRLYPLVSPKKSVEGAIGGLIGSLVGTVTAKLLFFSQLSYPDAILTALIIGSVGQAGDLLESMIKRSFGVKDSGSIIPGHGGVLDRLDSIILAAPVTYYYMHFFF